MSGMKSAIGAPTPSAADARRPVPLSSRPVTLACAILFALLVAAWVPLWLLARQSPLVNGGEGRRRTWQELITAASHLGTYVPG